MKMKKIYNNTGIERTPQELRYMRIIRDPETGYPRVERTEPEEIESAITVASGYYRSLNFLKKKAKSILSTFSTLLF